MNIHGEQDSAETKDNTVFSCSVALWRFIDFLGFISGIKHLNSGFPGTEFSANFSIFSNISVFCFPLLWRFPHRGLFS